MIGNYIKQTLTLGALTLVGVLPCSAQKSTMVSQWRDGDYIVRRYIISDDKPQTREYEILYEVNRSHPSTSFENNDAVFTELDQFFTELERDTLRHVKSISITGYASPDGTTPHNTTLARQRATELCDILDKRYNLRNRYNVVISSHVEKWSATAPAIRESSLDNRDNLVRVVNSNETPMTIDNRLKQQGKAWTYLTHDVLPDMRRTVIDIVYTEDTMSDRREYNPKQNDDVMVVEEYIIEEPRHRRHKDAIIVDEWEGVIIDMGAATEGYSR